MSARVRPRDHAAPRPERGPARPSLFRRLLPEHGSTDAALVRTAPQSGLESELAERLDSLLGIAERLAATHDRADLFRTIVDETKRALRVDYVTIRILRVDRLHVAASAGLPDAVVDAAFAEALAGVAPLNDKAIQTYNDVSNRGENAQPFEFHVHPPDSLAGL